MKIIIKRVNPTDAYPFVKELHEKLIPLRGMPAHEGVTSIIDDAVEKFTDQIINLENQVFINPPEVGIIQGDDYTKIDISFEYMPEDMYPKELCNCRCKF